MRTQRKPVGHTDASRRALAKKDFQGSRPVIFAVVTVNSAALFSASSDPHDIGIEIGAPARALAEYGAIDVAPRPLRR